VGVVVAVAEDVMMGIKALVSALKKKHYFDYSGQR